MLGQITALILSRERKNCARQWGVGRMPAKWKPICCRKRSSGDLIPLRHLIWERQIRSVRKVLNITLREQTLDDERLSTLFGEAESIVNGRPLTVSSDDPNDESPLTPNHFLFLRGGPDLFPGQFDQSDVYWRRWRHVQFLSDQFWKRWIREVGPREKFANPRCCAHHGGEHPLKNWPMGRVIQASPGKDGLVTTAQVRRRRSVFSRPAAKLCLLEALGDSMWTFIFHYCIPDMSWQ